MSRSRAPSELAYAWDDPNVCPFCVTELDGPGAGFIRHLGESPVCERGFDHWRESVAGDIGGEWSG
jgi:hypothetical protein